MLNKFPLWKNLMLVAVLVISFIYALPNIYGEDPAVQITGNNSKAVITPELTEKLQQALKQANVAYRAVKKEDGNLVFLFNSTDEQFKALPVVRAVISDQFTAAVNLAPATPQWLQMINAKPMKKGLDLQGGIHFLLDVDVQSAITKRLEGMVRGMSDQLRRGKLRYDSLHKKQDKIVIAFRDATTRNQARSLLSRDYKNIQFSQTTKGEQYLLVAEILPQFIQQVREYTMEQTLTTLRNRVNELGISEPIVQQQGANQISVDLPGVQDSAQAKQILGGTATLEFRLVDNNHDVSAIAEGGIAPPGTRLYYMTDGRPILLKSQIVLSGNSITSANSSFGEDGRPSVNITLGGGGEAFFHRITRENIGNQMAIVYVETKVTNKLVDGKLVKIRRKQQKVISAPVIQSALPNQFQITGLTDAREARNLALLLRAGAMPVGVDIIEERTIGASLGQQNIRLGMLSVQVAFVLIILFMLLYYRAFGIVADIALAVNLLLILAILSLLGATLTLPGIAGIVLTVGMAVDANVLIFERIREELRNGNSPQASIHAGFERALSTIIDANITTLIVGVVLFTIGSGPIKGFAITLCIGILTSMFTAVTFTRGMVNLMYGGKPSKRLSIGINVENK